MDTCLLVDDSYEISRSIFSMEFKQYIAEVYTAICHDPRFNKSFYLEVEMATLIFKATFSSSR